MYTNGQSVENLTATSGGTVTLYAIWGAECKCEAGTGIASCTASAPYGVCGKATSTLKTGYKDNHCSSPSITNPDTSICSATPITFTVKYQKSPAAATGTAPADFTCEYDKPCETVNRYEYTGYTFTGWGCTASSGTCASDTYTLPETGQIDIKNATSHDGATITLTPRWTARSYTLTYSCGLSAQGSPSTTSQTVTYDTEYTTAKLGTCKYPGYHATQWKVSINDKKDFDKKYTWTYTTSQTFQPDWQPNTYTVKYSCGDGTGTPPEDSTSKRYTETIDILKNPDNNGCTKTGFEFLNWVYNNKTYEAGSQSNALTTEDNVTVTLTANYKPKKVGCSAGKIFDHSSVKCVDCNGGYYCVAWCMKNGQPDCDYNQNGIYANIGNTKYSNNFTKCPTLTTSAAGSATLGQCYVSGGDIFKDNIKEFGITGIKSYIYVKQ